MVVFVLSAGMEYGVCLFLFTGYPDSKRVQLACLLFESCLYFYISLYHPSHSKHYCLSGTAN